MSRMKKIGLYWNTIKYLKPVQIKYQIENRIYKGKKKKYLNEVKKLCRPEKWKEIKLFIPELDCDLDFLHRFHVDKLLNNEIELLYESHQITTEWHVSDASHLWNYNLHYLEFLIPLAVKYNNTKKEMYFLKWKAFIEDWLKQSAYDSFEPYTISMRIPNLLICMELLRDEIRGTGLESQIKISLYKQYRYLLKTKERALLANHYLENLKAIVISSLLFQELDIYHKYFNLFLDEIQEQILPDGLHFERSLMYHKIVLEDILRIYVVLNSTCHTEDAEKLISIIQIMTDAMIKLEQGFHRTPLFNDAGSNVSKEKEALLKAVKRVCGYKETGNKNFESAGYYRFDKNDIVVLFDCGEIGPSYMGGHAHCDCLSFELCVNGKVLFANSGTGQYQGELRTFFRSTAAHNTIMIDDREQSELWGEHRVARRSQRIKAKYIESVLSGRFQSYEGDFFRRSLKWKNDKTLIIADTFKIQDKEIHVARQFLHLAPGFYYEKNGKQIYVLERQTLWAIIRLPVECDYLIHTEGVLTTYAENFGEYYRKQVLEIRTQFQDKIQSKIEIELKN